jgi:hypothetical protein
MDNGELLPHAVRTAMMLADRHLHAYRAGADLPEVSFSYYFNPNETRAVA